MSNNINKSTNLKGFKSNINTPQAIEMGRRGYVAESDAYF